MIRPLMQHSATREEDHAAAGRRTLRAAIALTGLVLITAAGLFGFVFSVRPTVEVNGRRVWAKGIWAHAPWRLALVHELGQVEEQGWNGETMPAHRVHTLWIQVGAASIVVCEQRYFIAAGPRVDAYWLER